MSFINVSELDVLKALKIALRKKKFLPRTKKN